MENLSEILVWNVYCFLQENSKGNSVLPQCVGLLFKMFYPQTYIVAISVKLGYCEVETVNGWTPQCKVPQKIAALAVVQNTVHMLSPAVSK